MKIAFYPVFDDLEKLRSYMFRATWYLKPLRKHIKSIDFFVNFNTSIEQVGSKNIECLDSSIANSLKDFSEVNIKKCTSLDGEILENYSFVLVHDEPSRNELIKIQRDNRLSFDIVRVDHDNVQYADSFFLRFAEKISGLHDEFRQKSKNKIEQYLPELKTEKIYLFGTGPNFSYVDNVDFSNGLVIACNSMVVNKEIINKLNPQLFVIADPIFHAGPSSYAESFRESLIDVLGEKEHPIVVPLRDYHIYLACFPIKIVERLVPVEFKKLENEKVQNLDIIKNNYVTTTSNILTLFQLPLASTLAKEIYISGCDGRPLSQNSYFWSHNKSVQINDKMTDIQQAHPSFFNISYDDYYSSHIETLEKWCKNIEDNGQEIFNLTPSYIPALQKRTTDLIIEQVLEKNNKIDLSIIMPLFNAEEFLERTINSILSNGFTGNFEILLIDDFSEDSSLSIAKEYAEKYENIEVIQNFYSKGVSGARNTGIKLARGKVICFLDADDFVYPKSLDKRYKRLISNSEIKMVHSTVKFVDDKDNYLGVEICTRRKVAFADCEGNPIHFNTLMIKKEIAKYLHFDESLTNGEDWLAFSKLMRLGYYSEYVEDASAAYRIHANSTVLKNFDKHEEKLVSVIDWLYKDVDSSEASPENLKALSKGSKQNILSSRSFNQFVMNVLKTDNFKPSVFLNDKQILSIVEDKNQNFDNRLKVALIRAFSLHIDNMHFISMRDKKRIRKNIGNIETLIGKNPFCNHLVTRLKLDESEISVAGANALYRDGFYVEAKKMYEKLILNNKFYKYLEFNVELCKKNDFSVSCGQMNNFLISRFSQLQDLTSHQEIHKFIKDVLDNGVDTKNNHSEDKDLSLLIDLVNYQKKCSSIDLIDFASNNKTRQNNIKIAIVFTGQLREYKNAMNNVSKYFASFDYLSIDYVVSTWRNKGGRASFFNENHIRRNFNGFFSEFLINQLKERGNPEDYLPTLKKVLENLFEPVVDKELKDLLPESNVLIEDDSTTEFSGYTNQDKMYYKNFTTLQMLEEKKYDLIIKLRPDRYLNFTDSVFSKLNWNLISDYLNSNSEIWVEKDSGFHLMHNGLIPRVCDFTAIGSQTSMLTYLGLYDGYEEMARKSLLIPKEIKEHASLGWWLFDKNLVVKNLVNMKGGLLAIKPDNTLILQSLKQDFKNKCFDEEFYLEATKSLQKDIDITKGR